MGNIINREEYYDEMDEISLREIIEAILKAKFMIITLVILAMICAGLFSFYINKKTSGIAMPVSFTFEGINEGKTPDDKIFNPESLLTPEILRTVILKLKLDKKISVKDLRAAIKIKEIIPDNIQEKQKIALKNGKDFIFVPTKYILTIKNNLSGKTLVDNPSQVLNEIIKEYRENFIKEYSFYKVLQNIMTSINFDDYDFEDIKQAFEKQIKMIHNFIEKMPKKIKDFRSTKNRLTLYDIGQRTLLIENMELKELRALTNIYNIAKNRKMLIQKLQYRIILLQLEKKKLFAEKEVAEELLSKYKREKTVLMSGEKTGLELDKKFSYYDILVKRAVNSGVEAKNKEVDIAFLENRIKKIKKASSLQPEQKNAEKDFIKTSKKLQKLLSLLIKQANEILSEYSVVKYQDTIRVLSPPEKVSEAKILLIIIISGVAAFFTGIFIALFRSYWKNSKLDSNK